MIFETHAHYDDEAFNGDRDELLCSMKENGIETIVNVGASFRGVEDTVKLMEQYSFVYGAVGIHPDEVGDLDEEKNGDTVQVLPFAENCCSGRDWTGLLLE